MARIGGCSAALWQGAKCPLVPGHVARYATDKNSMSGITDLQTLLATLRPVPPKLDLSIGDRFRIATSTDEMNAIELEDGTIIVPEP